MRRKEKEITGRAELDAIIRNAAVCRLAMTDGRQPYLVPLCFGYDGERLYFHSAGEGRKIDLLAGNDRVCFELAGAVSVLPGERPCKWSMAYETVIGFGTARFIAERGEKQRALEIITAHYRRLAGEEEGGVPDGAAMTEKAIDATVVFQVEITSLSGKRSGM